MTTDNKNLSGKEYVSVIAVAPLPDYRLAVRLSNGVTGAFDAKPILERPGIAQELRSPEYFTQVKLFFTGVGWPNGFDISPHAIEDELKPLNPGEVAPDLPTN